MKEVVIVYAVGLTVGRTLGLNTEGAMSADENDTCEDNMHRRWMVAEERADEGEVRVKELEAERDKLTERYKTIRDISALRLGEIDDTRALVFETVKERDRLAAENAGLREALNKHYPMFAGHAQRLYDDRETKAGKRWMDACTDIHKALAGDGSAVLAVKKTVRGALLECETYFESRADVADYSDETGHTPNEEMKLLTEVQEALAKLDSEDGKEAGDAG